MPGLLYGFAALSFILALVLLVFFRRSTPLSREEATALLSKLGLRLEKKPLIEISDHNILKED